VPGVLEKRARQLGAVLDRAEGTSKPNRERTLLGRAGKKVDRVLRKATALAEDGRLGAACVSALDRRMDEVRTALACVLGGP
jgi:hypothetical protein